MNVLWEELTRGVGDAEHLIIVLFRLLASVLCGGFIGLQREAVGKRAGVKTHILVSLGTTLLVLCCLSFGLGSDGLSRVVQGIITGIGFIGTGSILKINTEHDIHGLTTAASIWVTAAVGIVIGLGLVGLGVIATILSLSVLIIVGSIERKFPYKTSENTDSDKK